MSEILFRGKTIKDGKWVYGVPMQHVFGDFQILSGRVGAMCIDTVASETIGQYTGLYDMDGNKIFEGDIVTYDKEYGGETREKGTVYWCDGAFWVENVQDEEGYGLLGALVKYQLEIIGNIHDNPELLKGDKNE